MSASLSLEVCAAFPAITAIGKGYDVIHGYARVSTNGQSLDAQAEQLTAAGWAKVFRETASGAETDRAQLQHDFEVE